MHSTNRVMLMVFTAVVFAYIAVFGITVSDLNGIIRAGRAQIDSLTKELVDAQETVSTTIVHVDTLWRTRTVYVKAADEAQADADAVALLISDSTNACWQAYQARTSECGYLRQALAADSVSIRDTRDSLALIYSRLNQSLGHAKSLDAIIDSINNKQSCGIGIIPCPNRTTSFFLGAAATIFIGKVVF